LFFCAVPKIEGKHYSSRYSCARSVWSTNLRQSVHQNKNKYFTVYDSMFNFFSGR